MSNREAVIYLLTAVVVLYSALHVVAEEKRERRALPPEWPQEVRDVFFNDARRALVGPRPDYQSAARTAVSGSAAADATAEDNDDSYAWSKLVDADTLETEIKRQAPPLEPLIATPAAFKGGGYLECRDRFTWLATLFEVAGEYDQRVRWQDSADGLAQLFARAGFNCKVGTDQTFREAQLRVQDLAELVRGGRPEIPPTQPDLGWDRIADRSPLMRRMDEALNVSISPNASDGRALTGNAEQLDHEAQLLAMMAEVILQPGFDYSDDESYRGHAVGLRDAAVEFRQAVELENFQSAREAMGNMQKACTNCHDEWR